MFYYSNSSLSRINHVHFNANRDGTYFIEFDKSGTAYSIEIGEDVSQVIGQNAEVIIEHMGWAQFLAIEHQETFAHHRHQLSQGQIGISAYRVLHWDGSSRWVVDAARPLWGEGEDYVGAIEGRLVDFEQRPDVARFVKSLLL